MVDQVGWIRIDGRQDFFVVTVHRGRSVYVLKKPSTMCKLFAFIIIILFSRCDDKFYIKEREKKKEKEADFLCSYATEREMTS